MPSPRDQLAQLLGAFSPRLLDASARGSGWNSVWRIDLNGSTRVLKVYGRRRGRFREWMTDATHRLGGRTSYTAAARRDTEARCLRLWREAGFDVPALADPTPDFPRLPAPFLLMEYIPGPSLAKTLADPDMAAEQKSALWRRYAAEWGARHAAVLARGEPALLQEHPDLEHVLVSGDRLVTFDLEVAYTGAGTVCDRIAAELAGMVRSLFKRLPPEEARHLLRLLIDAYPDRTRLEAVDAALFANASPLKRLFHALDRRLIRKAGGMDKYAAARLLRNALNEKK